MYKYLCPYFKNASAVILFQDAGLSPRPTEGHSGPFVRELLPLEEGGLADNMVPSSHRNQTSRWRPLLKSRGHALEPRGIPQCRLLFSETEMVNHIQDLTLQAPPWQTHGKWLNLNKTAALSWPSDGWAWVHLFGKYLLSLQDVKGPYRCRALLLHY